MDWLIFIGVYTVMILTILGLKKKIAPEIKVINIYSIVWWYNGIRYSHISIVKEDEEDFWDAIGDDDEMFDINIYIDDITMETKIAVYNLTEKNDEGVWTMDNFIQVPKGEVEFNARRSYVI